MSHRVITTELPESSRLHPRIGPHDFVDCYAVASSLAPRRAAEIIVEFPAWVRGLFRLRRVLTAPFGLSNDGPPAADKIGLFPVEYEDSHELIAGFDDKHLEFRIAVMSADGRVALATWVHTHNLGGRLYLRAILPFHVLVVRNALTRVAAATP